ncbi:MAG: undecaprenyldiphospho-muramoylpentapeptide beta-N-acetylglucosaminyltransferase [Flavobacteriales bacterium]
MSVKVIISGGGTGGHIFPAISIANELKERIADIDILFVGAKGRMEMEKVPKAGYSILGLDINGLQRNWRDKRNLIFPFKLIKSLWDSYKIVKSFKPNLVIGTGGYASGPMLYVASRLSIPALIQEQNSYAGITNKLLAKYVDTICVAYEKMENFFPQEKIRLLGNPIRQDLLLNDEKKQKAYQFFKLDESKPVIVVVGGSLGARTINHCIALLLDKIEQNDLQLIWQTGLSYYETASKMCNDRPSLICQAFIYEMDLLYSVADVIISRAGASTISELCMVGKPTILIPSPNVAEDHQTKNAMALVNSNAALIVTDSLAKEQLGNCLFDLLNDDDKRDNLSKNIKSLAIDNSATLIVDEVEKLLHL